MLPAQVERKKRMYAYYYYEMKFCWITLWYKYKLLTVRLKKVESSQLD